MNRSLKLVAPLVAALTIAACNAGGTSNMPAASGVSQGSLSYKVIPQWMSKHQAKTECPQVSHQPTCLALQVQKAGLPRFALRRAAALRPNSLRAPTTLPANSETERGRTSP